MAEIIQETVTTKSNNPEAVISTQSQGQATGYQTIEYLIYFFFGALDILLAFRFILRLTGASMSSAFVGLIYGLTGIFTLPFEGIFHRSVTTGVETAAVFEPATLIAIVVYAVLAVGIVKLVRIFSGKQQQAD